MPRVTPLPAPTNTQGASTFPNGIQLGDVPLTIVQTPDPSSPGKTCYSFALTLEGVQQLVPIIVPLLVLLLWSTGAFAAQRTVCASGCTNTTVQAAVDAAVAANDAGGTILLESGRLFTERVVLKPFAACVATNPATYITMRTGVNSTGTVLSTSIFPAADKRITPAYASVLAKIMSNNDSTMAIDAAGTAPGCYELKWLEIQARPAGNNYVMRLGSDTQACADIPGGFILNQLYIHGDPVRGSFRGIGQHATSVTMKDSYLSDIKAMDEGQAIYINSTPDAGTYTNNHIEGGAEVLFSGGAHGGCTTSTTVTAATSGSSFTLGTHGGFLKVGQSIAVDRGAGVLEQTDIASCGTSTANALCTADAVTVTPALDFTPSVGAAVTWGLVPGGLVATKNYFTRPITWRNPIVNTPQGVTATPSTSGGTLAAGTYNYRVVARLDVAQAQSGRVARSTASVEVSATTTGTTGSVTIKWSPVASPAADRYRVYGRSAGGENIYFEVTTSACTGTPVVCSVTDTGAAGTAENVPTSTGSTWQVKNTMEFKNMDGALVEGNIIENSWVAAQAGYCFLLTPSNTGASNPSTRTAHITFRNNWVRHCAGGFQMEGRDNSGGTTAPTGRSVGNTITNNLWSDINTSAYGGGSARTLILTTNFSQAYSNAPDTNGPLDTLIAHNTFDHTNGNSPLFFDHFKNGTAFHAVNFVYRDNILYRLNIGIAGNNGALEGNDAWTKYTSGTSSFTNNAVADATGSIYPSPSTNLFPTAATLHGYFTDWAAGNYVVKAGTPLKNAATDQTDIGANISAITAFTNIAVSGDNSGSAPPNPPVITTTTLANVSVGTTFTPRTLTSTGGTGSVTWALAAGSGPLPTGVTLSAAGVLSGTPTVPGTFAFTVQAMDSLGLTDSQALSLTIDEVIIPTPRATRIGWTEAKNFRRNVCATDLDATNDEVAVGDLCFEFSTGIYLKVAATAPTLTLERVGPSAVLPFLNSPGSYLTWTLSTTPSELIGAGRNRLPYDLTGFSQCRLYSRVGTAIVGANSTVWAQYSTDTGSNWNDLGVTASTPALSLDASTNMTVGTYAPIADGAKTDVLLRLEGVSTAGTITTQPQVGNTGMICK